MKNESKVNSAHFSSNGQRVVTASNYNTARLWDAFTGKPIGEPMEHEGFVESAAIAACEMEALLGDEERAGRIIHGAVFARLPLSEFVVADPPLTDANVFMNSESAMRQGLLGPCRFWPTLARYPAIAFPCLPIVSQEALTHPACNSRWRKSRDFSATCGS